MSQTNIDEVITLAEINHQAFTKYDVIVKTSSIKEERESYEVREEVVRQIFDADKKLCTILRYGAAESAKGPGSTPSLGSGVISACLIKDTELVSRSWPGKTQHQKNKSFADSRLIGESISFEFVGFMPFPVSRTAMLSKSGAENIFDDSAGFWTTFRSLWRNGKVSETSKDVSVFQSEAKNNVLLELEVDERNLLPKRFSALGRKANGEYRRIQNEFVDWKTVSDVNVPTRISRDKVFGAMENDVLNVYESSDEYEFEWISINESLSDSLFESSILDDSQNVVRLLKLHDRRSKK